MILEHVDEMAYQLDLAAKKHQALRGLRDVFHVGLLRHYQSNKLDYKELLIKSNGEEQYEVQAILKHCVVCGEMWFLVKWIRYDELENLWLTAS